MKIIGFSVLLCLTFAGLSLASPADSQPSSQPATRPILKVEKDGYPSGHDTPEGAACDLARAFIQRDAALFKETCIPLFGGGQNRDAYKAFLDSAKQGIEAEQQKTVPSPSGPKSIGKLFAARHLSLDGPASAGYALFNFNDVMFVDVGVIRQDGKRQLVRTLVIEDSTNHWFVHPDPGDAPLLSMGLNDEKPSQQDFRQAYQVVAK
jgi:hypothetical protein